MDNSVFSVKYIAVLVLMLLVCLSSSYAQTSYYFYVQLSDKSHSPYSLLQPTEYLSERAISRRAAFGLVCDSTDLPVSPLYLKQIAETGARIHNVSKWMNGVTVLVSDSGLMNSVRKFPFVRFVEYTGRMDGPALAPRKTKSEAPVFDYGIASTQIEQLKGKSLHNAGYRGKDIHIAVLDAGFTNVDKNPFFDSLRLQRRLLGTKDIVNPNSNIYNEDSHGAMVLATMAANVPGQFLGTAPDASYWLIRTEYAPTEYKVETDFWTSGIEFADSVGGDLVNSSLGYSTFDDPKMNFTYGDMNGKVSRASRAANLASKKGMLVVTSAGNEGNQSWHYIGSPADADGIVTVGAVTSKGISSTFSSYGPSSDGRVKPEVCAMGTSSAVVNTAGVPTYGNGTSFASPVLAGMMACLLQRFKSLEANMDMDILLNTVFRSAGLYSSPTAQQGYGIPDFEKAEQNLITFDKSLKTDKSDFILTYNSLSKRLTVRYIGTESISNASVRVFTVMGGSVTSQHITLSTTYIDTETFSTGIYAVCISWNGKTETRKILIR